METPPRARWTRASRRAPASGPPVRKDAGKGRVVYIPGIVFKGPLPEHGGYFEINNRFWKLPKNWTELTDAVRWAARQDIPVQIDAPSYVAVNVVAQPKERRWFVHLVNYNASSGMPAKSIEAPTHFREGTLRGRSPCIRPI